MSRGTEILRVTTGSLSIIMSVSDDYVSSALQVSDAPIHSSSFWTLFSIASAGLHKTAFQTLVCTDMRTGRKRISRLGALDADSARHAISSKTRVPIR